LKFISSRIDLCMRVNGRMWINDDEKVPSGEVFSPPLEDSVEGSVEFDFPAVWGGIEVNEVKLVRKGEVAEARALRSEEFLRKMLEVDEGARRLGEMAFGLNYDINRITRDALLNGKKWNNTHGLGISVPPD